MVSFLLGFEGVGIIVVVGLGVMEWVEGDKVCVFFLGGVYVEYVLILVVYCLLIFEDMFLCEVVCLFEIYFIVWFNVFECGGLKVGEWFFVYGGLLGIGMIVI